jgi:hypothetical protein
MLLKFLVIKTVDPDLDRYLVSNAGAGFTNEYGSKTLVYCLFLILVPLPTQGSHEDTGGPALSLHQINFFLFFYHLQIC